MLSLALAFNDFKGLEWTNRELERSAPGDVSGMTAAVAEWIGMRLHIARWEIGIVHEVLRAIGAAHYKRILAQPVARETVRRMLPVPDRHAWLRLVRAARGQPADAQLRPYLANTRNIAAFHYSNWAELLAGYQQAFAEPLTERNRAAYLSVGKSMARTRFFFADAAVQQLYVGREHFDKMFAAAGSLRPLVDAGLRGFVTAYLRVRKEGMSSQ